MPIPLGILAVAGAGAGGGGAAYDLLETISLSSNTTSVTFSNINQGYKHLQIRSVVRGTGGNSDFFRIRFNSSTNAIYSYHQLVASGASVAQYSSSSLGYTEIISRIRGTSSNTNANSAIVSEILDYTNTNKHKSIRSFGGAPIANSGDPQEVDLASGGWASTDAITSIEIYTNGSSQLAANSRFSLYGVK